MPHDGHTSQSGREVSRCGDRWSVVGSPAYFARAGQPRKPEDLTEHGVLFGCSIPMQAPYPIDISKASIRLPHASR